MTNNSGRFFALFLFIVTLTYGIFQARTLIQGPSLAVLSPRPGETISSVLMDVRGNTENVTRVSLNGQTIPMDTKGVFTTKLVTPEGYGVLLVEATNRFGRHQEERVEFLGKPVRDVVEVVETEDTAEDTALPEEGEEGETVTEDFS